MLTEVKAASGGSKLCEEKSAEYTYTERTPDEAYAAERELDKLTRQMKRKEIAFAEPPGEQFLKHCEKGVMDQVIKARF